MGLLTANVLDAGSHRAPGVNRNLAGVLQAQLWTGLGFLDLLRINIGEHFEFPVTALAGIEELLLRNDVVRQLRRLKRVREDAERGGATVLLLCCTCDDVTAARCSSGEVTDARYVSAGIAGNQLLVREPPCGSWPT